tara:strand:+ start:2949 stop:3332 length:384 start_codon:yes stop_codon:yes gene_type:complete
MGLSCPWRRYFRKRIHYTLSYISFFSSHSCIALSIPTVEYNAGTEQGSRIGGDDFASFDFPDSTPAASATSDTPVDNTVIMSATATDNNEVPGVAEDERKSDDRANTEVREWQEMEYFFSDTDYDYS